MKYRTKKQRAELYRIAAEIISLKNHSDIFECTASIKEPDLDINFLESPFCCDVIAGLARLDKHEYTNEEIFPEFFMFKPTKFESVGLSWWEDYNREIRSIALLLAAELCNN